VEVVTVQLTHRLHAVEADQVAAGVTDDDMAVDKRCRADPYFVRRQAAIKRASLTDFPANYFRQRNMKYACGYFSARTSNTFAPCMRQWRCRSDKRSALLKKSLTLP